MKEGFSKLWLYKPFDIKTWRGFVQMYALQMIYAADAKLEGAETNAAYDICNEISEGWLLWQCLVYFLSYSDRYTS